MNTEQPNIRGDPLSDYSSNTSATLMAALRTSPNPVDQLHTAFNNVAESYNQLWLLRQHDMPDDIVMESFQQMNTQLLELTRIVQQQTSTHARETRIRERTERVAAQIQQTQQPVHTIEAPVHTIEAPVHPIDQVTPIAIDNDVVLLTEAANRRIRTGIRKITALKKTEVNQPMPEPCCICMEEYTRVQSVTTSCSHTFCKTCYDEHERTAHVTLHKAVCCPICRTRKPKVTEYRARASRVAVAHLVVAHIDVTHASVEVTNV